MNPDMTIFYVSDIEKSAAFYGKALNQQPQELSPGFAMFLLPNGLKIGLWKTEAVIPETRFTGCGSELVLHVESDAAVEMAHEDWQAAGLPLTGAPFRREFGLSLVAEGPDGHRVRVLHPAG